MMMENLFFSGVNDTTRYFNDSFEFKKDVKDAVVASTFGKAPVHLNSDLNREVYYQQTGSRYVLIDKVGDWYKVYSGESVISKRRPKEVDAAIELLNSSKDNKDYLSELPLVLTFDASYKEQYSSDDIYKFEDMIFNGSKTPFDSLVKNNPLVGNYVKSHDEYVKKLEELGVNRMCSEMSKVTQEHFLKSFGVINSTDLYDLVISLNLNKKYDQSFFKEAKKEVAVGYDFMTDDIMADVGDLFDGVKKLKGMGKNIGEFSLSNSDNRVVAIIEGSILVIDKNSKNTDFTIYCRDFSSANSFVEDIDAKKINSVSELIIDIKDFFMTEIEENKFKEVSSMLKSAVTKLDDLGVINCPERNLKLM